MLLKHVISALLVMLCVVIYSYLRSIVFDGNHSLLIPLRLIPGLLPMALVFGIVVRILSNLPRRINPGIFFSIVYTFIVFPLPVFLGGQERYWWAYPLAIIQIIVSGYLYSIFLSFLNSKFPSKISKHE